jgi:hypothetical protein
VEFEVERFERVTAGSGALLLRVAGRWRSAAELELGPATLLVDDGRTSHRLDALPGPDATTAETDRHGRPWRAAFAAPADLLDGGPRAFSLQAGHVVVALPAPVRAELAGEQSTVDRELAAAQQEVAAARVEADGLRAQAQELTARLEAMELGALDAQATVDERVEAAQAAASAERARAERLEEQLEEARAELGAVRQEERALRPPARPPGETDSVRATAPRAIVPVQRPRPPTAGLPAEWLVALVLLGVGVVVVLVVLSGVFP